MANLGTWFRATIPDDTVADAEVGELAVGNVITHGFRVFSAETLESPVSGSVVWSRLDSRAGIEDIIVDVDGLQFLTQVQSESPTVSVGDSLPLDGRMVGVRPYEYDAFGTPDVSRRWLIRSVERERKTLDWLLEIEPMDLEADRARPDRFRT